MRLATCALAALLLTASAVGCGASAMQTNSQRATTMAAQVVYELETSTDGPFQAAVTRAVQQSDTTADYDRRVRPWQRLTTALRTAHHVLFAAQRALDAMWLESDDAPWQAIAPCIADMLVELDAAAHALGFDTPDVVARAFRIVSAFAGECRADEVMP